MAMMTAKQLDKYGDYVYPLVRIIVGFLFACHGAQKLFGVLGSHNRLEAVTLAMQRKLL